MVESLIWILVLMNLHHLEVINALPVDEDILVEAQIDNSSGDDNIVATAEIVTRKQRRHRYTIPEKLMILRQVH